MRRRLKQRDCICSVPYIIPCGRRKGAMGVCVGFPEACGSCIIFNLLPAKAGWKARFSFFDPIKCRHDARSVGLSMPRRPNTHCKASA